MCVDTLHKGENNDDDDNDNNNNNNNNNSKIRRAHNGIQHMWNVKKKLIAVIVGGTGTMSKSFR
jgi:hypothetical protein